MCRVPEHGEPLRQPGEPMAVSVTLEALMNDSIQALFPRIRLLASVLLCIGLSSCAALRMEPLTKDDYAQIVLATLQREQLSSPMSIFLKFHDISADEVAPLVQKRLSAGVTVKSKMDDLKPGSLSGCDSDKVTKGAALTLTFSSPELNPGRATLIVNFRSCAIDAHTDEYTYHNLGNEWTVEDIRAGSMG